MTSRPPHPQPEQYYLVSESELQMIADQFKRGDNPFVAKRMGGIISDISSRPVSHSSPAAAPVPDALDVLDLELQAEKSRIESSAMGSPLSERSRGEIIGLLYAREKIESLRGEQPGEEKP